MSQHDLPLWARGVAALLLVIASWWLLHTEALRGVVGDSISLVGLGLVSLSILRGMHLPIGVWPSGPWRERFSLPLVVAVALAFAAVVVVADPEAEDLVGRLDPGMFLVVISGVVAWGLSWTLVRQRGFIGWYGVALAAGVVPTAVGVLGLVLRAGSGAESCVIVPGAACTPTVLQAFGFSFAVWTAAALVTLELTFRRLLIGDAGPAGLVLVLGAAALFGIWGVLVGRDVPAVAPPWWLGSLAAVTAGGLYALSGSALVSGLYTALVFAGQDAVQHVVPIAQTGAPPPAAGIEYYVAHLAAAAAFAFVLARRRPLLGGIR